MKRTPLCVAFAVALIQVGVARSSEPKSQAAPQIVTPADEVKQMEMRPHKQMYWCEKV